MRTPSSSQSLSLALLIMTAPQIAMANTANTATGEIEKIAVTGSYIEGYNAHTASGASRMELAIEDIPQSVSVITSAQLNDFQLTDINLALDTATGVNVQRIETDRTYYTARGFDITNFQIDGIGLPLTSGNNHAGEDTAIYDRVEVIRGANGLMTGVGNPSATVNYIRKRPEAENALSLSGHLGSHDFQRITADGTYHINDSVSARAVAVTQSTDSYLDRYSRDNTVFYAFINAQLTNHTSLSLSHSNTDKNANGNLWGALPLYYTDGSATNYDRSTSTSADWSFWDVNNQNTVLELNHLFANDWRLRATYSHKTTDEDSDLFYVYGTPDRQTELGLTGYASEYILHDQHDLYDVYVDGDFSWLGRDHQFVAGLNYSKMAYTDRSLYDFTSGNGFPEIPNLNTWEGNAVYPDLIDGENGSDVEQRQAAAYFTTRFNVIDDLYVLAGGRYNDWEAKGSSYGVDRDVSDSDFIPYAGVVYGLNDDVNLYASYTETFQAQNELDINNQQLDPVVGESKEVGAKFSLFNNNAVASIAYFDVQQVNLAIADPATADLPPTNQRYIASEGIGSHGFEIDIAGEVITGLNVSVGYTDFTISGDALVAEYTPSNLFKLSTTYDFANVEGLTLGLNTRWQNDTSRIQGVVGEGFVNTGDTITTTQEAYAITDVLVKYQVNDDVAVNLNVFNVSDEKYLTSLYWAQGYYGAPRSVSVGVSWTL